MKMNRYHIKHKDGSYLSVGKMKPTNIKNAKYKKMGYWSNYTDEYAIKARVRRVYFLGILEIFLIKILSGQNVKLEHVK